MYTYSVLVVLDTNENHKHYLDEVMDGYVRSGKIAAWALPHWQAKSLIPPFTDLSVALDKNMSAWIRSGIPPFTAVVSAKDGWIQAAEGEQIKDWGKRFYEELYKIRNRREAARVSGDTTFDVALCCVVKVRAMKMDIPSSDTGASTKIVAQSLSEDTN